MARPLHDHLLSPPYLTSISTNTTFLLVLASIAAISSMIIHLCTTHKHFKTSRNSKEKAPGLMPAEERRLLSSLSGIGSKALAAARMVYWKKGGAEEEEEEEEELWRKTILMGDKCRALDFSGQIVYDGEGNQQPKVPKAVGRGGGGR